MAGNPVTGRRYLLISRAGAGSLHRRWLAPQPDRAFDVLLSAYDPAVAAETGDGVMFERRPGRKVAGYGEILREHEALLRRYDYVALFDDDLLIDGGALSNLFRLVDENRLKIAQPALTHDSFFTYACLLRHPGFRLRHVNFVEMMCPVFRTDILLQVRPLFEMGYESGIDLIWCNLAFASAKDFAVIDATPVRHTRRVGSQKAANGFDATRQYETDIEAILSRFGLPWLACLPYGGIREDGVPVRGHRAFAPAAASLALAAPRVGRLSGRWRNIAVYWRHLLRARARNIAVGWPTGGPGNG